MHERSLVRKLAEQSAHTDDPLQWFEVIYQKSQQEDVKIPWDDDTPNPNLVDFCNRQKLIGTGKTALTIGSGFGHDAEHLSSLGFEVTGFDLAPTAIKAAKAKFPNSRVRYAVADLFALPNDDIGRHAFVLEAYTLQALPYDLRQMAIPIIASLVELGGSLLVITRGREERDPPGDMPYPLTKSEILGFEDHGLAVAQFEDYMDNEDPPLRRFRVHFKKC